MAINANFLPVDLTRTLPTRRGEPERVGTSPACCLPCLHLAPVKAAPPVLDMDQAQVSIVDSDHDLAQSIARMLHTDGFAARTCSSPVIAGMIALAIRHPAEGGSGCAMDSPADAALALFPDWTKGPLRPLAVADMLVAALVPPCLLEVPADSNARQSPNSMCHFGASHHPRTKEPNR